MNRYIRQKADNFTLDRFRIKIWQEDQFGTEIVIYDNALIDVSNKATIEMDDRKIKIQLTIKLPACVFDMPPSAIFIVDGVFSGQKTKNQGFMRINPFNVGKTKGCLHGVKRV